MYNGTRKFHETESFPDSMMRLVQIERVMHRDVCSREVAERRVDAQLPGLEQVRLANEKLDNTGSKGSLITQVGRSTRKGQQLIAMATSTHNRDAAGHPCVNFCKLCSLLAGACDQICQMLCIFCIHSHAIKCFDAEVQQQFTVTPAGTQ